MYGAFGNPNLSYTPSTGQVPQGYGQPQNPQGVMDYGKPSLMQSAAILNPLASSPVWGNPYQHQQAAIDSISSKPMDAAMWVGQRVAAPIMAYKAANLMFGGWSGAGAQVGKSMFSGLGSGLATGFGAGEGVAGMVGGGLGWAGGAVGSLAAPWAASQALMWGAEKAVFNPYINTRRSANDLRDNFRGITLGDATGHAITGRGLGGFESAQMAGDITFAGISDMSFSTGEYSAGASMIGRAGLLDSVGTKAGITKRIKEGMDQVKLVMSIMNNPSMQDAVAEISKLVNSGASMAGGTMSVASGALMKMNGMASQAGVSIQRLMDSTNFGSQMYGANGMTPYLGQLAAANAYASFSMGHRQGLISTGQLARMGGIEGATQSLLGGSIASEKTPYAQLSNYNEYLGGGRGNSLVSNISNISRSMSVGTLDTLGGMGLYGDQLGGIHQKENGNRAVEKAIVEYHNSIAPGQPLTMEKAYLYMTSVLGMSPDQARAYAASYADDHDDGVMNARVRSERASGIEQTTQFRDNNSLYTGDIGRLIHRTKRIGQGFNGAVADAFGIPAAETVGSMSDMLTKVADYTLNGNTDQGNVQRDINLINTGGTNGENQLKSIINKGGDLILDANSTGNKLSAANIRTTELADSINGIYLKGEGLGFESANDYMKATTEGGRRNALKKLRNDGALSRQLTEGDIMADAKGLESLKRIKASDSGGYDMRVLKATLSKAWDTPNPEDIPESSNNPLDIITSAGALGKNHTLQEQAYAANLAISIDSDTSINQNSDDKDLSKNKALLEYASLRGEKDNLDKAYAAARQTGKYLRDKGYQGSLSLADAEYIKKHLNESSKEFAVSLARDAGGLKHDEGGGSDGDNEEKKALANISLQHMKQIHALERAHQSGQIDNTKYNEIRKSLDERENTDKFGTYVEAFGRAVAGMPGSKKDSELVISKNATQSTSDRLKDLIR